MIKAVIFDFFGVLYPDTFWGLANQFVPGRDKAVQIEMHDLIRRADLNKINQSEFWNEAASLLNISITELEKARDAYGGVDQALMSRIETLKKNGFKVGIISNVGSGMIESTMTDVERDLFDVMVLSGDTGYVKPDPQVYQLAVDQLGIEPSEGLFVDDIPRNVRGAENIGMEAVLYTGLPDYDEAINRLVPDMNN